MEGQRPSHDGGCSGSSSPASFAVGPRCIQIGPPKCLSLSTRTPLGNPSRSSGVAEGPDVGLLFPGNAPLCFSPRLPNAKPSSETRHFFDRPIPVFSSKNLLLLDLFFMWAVRSTNLILFFSTVLLCFAPFFFF